MAVTCTLERRNADERLVRVDAAHAAPDAARHRRAARRDRRVPRLRVLRTRRQLDRRPGDRRRVDRPGGAVRDRRRARRAADDRRRVRPVRRRDDRQLRPAARLPRDARAHEHLAGDGARPAVRPRRRSRQRHHGGEDPAAELHRHARDLLHPAGRQRGGNAQADRDDLDRGHRLARTASPRRDTSSRPISRSGASR